MTRTLIRAPRRRTPARGGVLLLLVLLVSLAGRAVGQARAEPTWTVLAGGRTDPGEFNGPWDVAVDLAGNLYVADTDNHRVQKVSPAGELLAQWGSYGSDPGQFRGPMGVAVDAQGNVYVAVWGNHRIQRD